MSEVIITNTVLNDIANAIREKTGESGLLLPSQFVNAIDSIQYAPATTPSSTTITPQTVKMDDSTLTAIANVIRAKGNTTNNLYPQDMATAIRNIPFLTKTKACFGSVSKFENISINDWGSFMVPNAQMLADRNGRSGYQFIVWRVYKNSNANYTDLQLYLNGFTKGGYVIGIYPRLLDKAYDAFDISFSYGYRRLDDVPTNADTKVEFYNGNNFLYGTTPKIQVCSFVVYDVPDGVIDNGGFSSSNQGSFAVSGGTGTGIVGIRTGRVMNNLNIGSGDWQLASRFQENVASIVEDDVSYRYDGSALFIVDRYWYPGLSTDEAINQIHGFDSNGPDDITWLQIQDASGAMKVSPWNALTIGLMTPDTVKENRYIFDVTYNDTSSNVRKFNFSNYRILKFGEVKG